MSLPAGVDADGAGGAMPVDTTGDEADAGPTGMDGAGTDAVVTEGTVGG
jgi:hypothetical protein